MDETVSLRQGMEFFGCMPKKGKTESYGSSIFIFIFRKLHLHFHNGCTSLYSNQQWLALSSHILSSICFLDIWDSDEGKLESRIVQMCIFVIAKDGEHFKNIYWSFTFILLRTVLYIISFINWQFGVFNFFAVLLNSVYYPPPIWHIWQRFFSHSVICVYVLCW